MELQNRVETHLQTQDDDLQCLGFLCEYMLQGKRCFVVTALRDEDMGRVVDGEMTNVVDRESVMFAKQGDAITRCFDTALSLAGHREWLPVGESIHVFLERHVEDGYLRIVSEVGEADLVTYSDVEHLAVVVDRTETISRYLKKLSAAKESLRRQLGIRLVEEATTDRDTKRVILEVYGAGNEKGYGEKTINYALEEVVGRDEATTLFALT